MRLLDLFCGAGGAAMGYHRAGFEVVGVDIEPQPDYPFEFVQADALNYPVGGVTYDAVHASPPCQAHTTMANRYRGKGGPTDDHLDLIAATRDKLDLFFSGPYVIENVMGARSEMKDPVTLTGEMFGLGVHRPRLFELGRWSMMVPAKPPRSKAVVAVYGKLDGRRVWTRKDGTELRAAGTMQEAQEAMDMPWVNEWRGIAEAIPPAYTEFIGHQLMEVLNG